MPHWGIIRDDEHAASIPPERRCKRCDGTGNEFFSMYRRCSDCDGSGILPESQTNQKEDE